MPGIPKKIKLEKSLEQEEVITTKIVHKIIKDNFGVDYSYKQIKIIASRVYFKHYFIIIL